MTDLSTSAPVSERAAGALQDGKDAAVDVAQTVGEHAQEVAQETARQARDLLGEARGNLREQAGAQHKTLVSNLRSLSSELGGMTQRSEQSGVATELVSRAQQQVDGIADWMDKRDPADLLDELRNFGRRRPGTFLLGALAAGVVAGRLTRGVVASHTSDDDTAATRTAATAGSAPSFVADHPAAPPPMPLTGQQPPAQLGYSSGGYSATGPR